MKFSKCGMIFSLVVPNDEKNQVAEQVQICRIGKNMSVYDLFNQYAHSRYMVHFP